MDPINDEILAELKKINTRLEKLTHLGKVSFSNFISGVFHSLGALFGTLVIASALIYIFSQFNFTKSISSFIEKTLSQVNFEKIVAPQPTPTIEQETVQTN